MSAKFLEFFSNHLFIPLIILCGILGLILLFFVIIPHIKAYKRNKQHEKIGNIVNFDEEVVPTLFFCIAEVLGFLVIEGIVLAILITEFAI